LEKLYFYSIYILSTVITILRFTNNYIYTILLGFFLYKFKYKLFDN